MAKVTSKTNPEIKKITTRFLDKNVKISPRKLRLTANLVKKMLPLKALDNLAVTNTKAARLMSKAIKTAIADAVNNHKLDQTSLEFASILVNESVKYKRMDKAHSSRFARGIIQKRHSRLTINILGVKSL